MLFLGSQPFVSPWLQHMAGDTCSIFPTPQISLPDKLGCLAPSCCRAKPVLLIFSVEHPICPWCPLPIFPGGQRGPKDFAESPFKVGLWIKQDHVLFQQGKDPKAAPIQQLQRAANPGRGALAGPCSAGCRDCSSCSSEDITLKLGSCLRTHAGQEPKHLHLPIISKNCTERIF